MFAMLIRSILVNIYIQDAAIAHGDPYTNIGKNGVARGGILS